MSNKLKNILTLLLPGVFILVFTIWAFVKPADDFSISERKKLTQMPKFSFETLMNGKFISTFESYTNDQFPLRDKFRTVKAVTTYNVFNLKDNNNIYIKDGYAVQILYPCNTTSLDYAVERFDSIIQNYAVPSNAKVYFSVVPDKHMFFKGNDMLSFDYSEFEKYYVDTLKNTVAANNKNGVVEVTYLDIMGLLNAEDYFKTDTHWKAERLEKVAVDILKGMGNMPMASYIHEKVSDSFYGVYYGQAALPLAPDAMYSVYAPYFDGLTSVVSDTNKTYTGKAAILNEAALTDKDPYEYYLYGSKSLITITNPEATSDKTLIVFRDSFGSSIAPYFAECYKTVYLADIRYAPTKTLCNMLDFTDADVLFIYSTSVLNNSGTMKK